MISRRSLLLGAPALIAAPAIVRAASLMAVKPIDIDAIGSACGLQVYETDFDTARLIWRDQEVWSARYVAEKNIFAFAPCPLTPNS